MRILPKNFVAIDVETTGGYDPIRYDIIQIGVAIIDRETGTILKTYSSFVKPLSSDRDPKAMEVNGIKEEQLVNAPDLERVLSNIENLIDGDIRSYRIASWGTYFDVNYLQYSYKKIGRKYPWRYDCYCLKSIICSKVCELANRGIVKLPKQWGLKSVMDAMGLEFIGRRHSALADIINTIRLLNYLDRLR